MYNINGSYLYINLSMAFFRKLSGTVFGKYTLSEYLGYTGVAHVYKAVDSGTKKEAAVHLLPNHFVDQPRFSEGFINKASTLLNLRHNSIVQMLDCGVDQGYPYLVMENIESPTLQDLIDSSKQKMRRIPLEACIFIINSLGSALSHAHKQNITHGNLQPMNILLEENGAVVITDFGFYHIMIYKPQFSPGMEEKSGLYPQDLLVDKQRDITAMGAIFYHIVTGRPPYDETSTLLFSRDKPKAEIVPPSEIVPEILPKLEEIILKTLSEEREEQYHDIRDILKDLAMLSQEVKTTMLPSAQLTDIAEFSSRFTKDDTPWTFLPEKPEKAAIYFPDMGKTLELKEGKEYIIGRAHEGQPMVPDIDLTPFKGYQWGISRMHASLKITPGKATITDLGSSNGTWHKGERIPPNEQKELTHGDIILLGRLQIQILIPDQNPE